MKVRRSTSKRSALAAVLAVALVTTLGTTLTGTAAATDRTATEHRAGGKTVATKTSAKPKMFRLNHGAGEPTIGITRDGSVFYTASSGCVTSCTGQPQMAETVAPGGRAIFMTPNNGKTWNNVSPGHPSSGASPHVLSMDPYLYVDKGGDNDRVFDIDLTIACSELSYSDDKGKTWITNPMACGEPVNDHQTVFTGKPVTSPTVLYNKIVYYCFNHPAFTKCNKSLNGGLSFQSTATITNPECSGLNGHGVTDSKGVIYLPYTGCNNAPALAVSKDEGDNWTILTVPGQKVNGGDPSVAVDSKDNVYFLWNDADRKPVMATSKNGGKSWSKPINVAAPGVVQTNLATITVGAPGKVAIAYYGTTTDEKNGFWNGYLASGVGLLGKNPVFYTAAINDPKDPLKAKGCGPGRCGRVLDFIDVEISPTTGAPWGAYVDACRGTCIKTGTESYADNEGVVGTLVGGPRLNK
jgi:hypothetical protein